MIRTFAAIAACSLALALAACSGSKDKETSETSSAPSDNPAGDTAASVNGRTISREEVERIYTNMARQNIEPEPGTQGNSPEERLYRTAVDLLVEQILVEEGARKAGLTVSDGQVASEVTRMKTASGGPAAFQKLLDENGVKEQDVEKDIRSRLTARMYFERVAGSSPPPVSDEEVEEYFESNPERFGAQPEVNARHILVMTKPDMDDMARAEARRRAEASLARVRGGEDFAAVANETTEDPTNQGKGGDLGWFPRGAMVAPFDSAAFDLKPGEVSGIVETSFGYHVIRVEDRRETEPRSLDSVREGIRMSLAQEKMGNRFRAVVDSLRADAKVVIEPVEAEHYQTP